MMTARKVTIRFNAKRRFWFVSYLARKRGQRYTAAQFYSIDTTLDDVERWVKQQPNLELVEP